MDRAKVIALRGTAPSHPAGSARRATTDRPISTVNDAFNDLLYRLDGSLSGLSHQLEDVVGATRAALRAGGSAFRDEWRRQLRRRRAGRPRIVA